MAKSKSQAGTPRRKRVVRTRAQIAREKQIREKYQREKPSLADLQASGEFTAPIRQQEYWQLVKIFSRLRALRTEAGLSLADMSRRTGMDRAALSRLENAVVENPTIDTLSRYADALGKRLVVKIVDA